ncbi:MAG: Exportin-2, partial [Paramarteilia canceri]
INPEQTVNNFPAVLQYLLSQSDTVVLYAAYTVDQLLKAFHQLMLNGNNQQTQKVLDFMPNVLKHLLLKALQEGPDSSDDISKILIKTTIQIFVVFKEKAFQIIVNDFDDVIQMLTKKIQSLGETEGAFLFLHSLYDLLAILIRISFKIAPDSIAIYEKHLFPIFEFVFSKNLIDSIPYSLQVMALMLELQKGRSNISHSYDAIIKPLLTPQLWEVTGNVCPVIILVERIIYSIPERLDADFIKSLQNIIKRLIATRSLESQAISLINYLLFIPESCFTSLSIQKSNFVKECIELILMKIKFKKTKSILVNFSVTLGLLMNSTSFDYVDQILNSIQPGLNIMVYQKLFFPAIAQIDNKTEMLIAANGALLVFNSPLYSQFK